jgi:L-seryl-tRNA(Ser) seleniumtransferase
MNNKVILTKRDIPSVEVLASDNSIVECGRCLPRPFLVEIIRQTVESIKSRLDTEKVGIEYNDLLNEIIDRINIVRVKKIGRVLNGTGILIHTNLGRAPLPEGLFDNIKSHITGYGNLEFDIKSGTRGSRGEMAEKYLALLSGAEDGLIVNNNAAALFLILNTLANKKNVVISRGELIQIGGGFRIPDIIRKAGAKLIEIGTTNITTLADYRASLEYKPALFLKIHRSNFTVAGFTDEADFKSLTKLGDECSIPVINDLGSGVFIDTSRFMSHSEPTVQSSVNDGAALTCFSGDKLLGGVQSGLIAGQKEYIRQLKKNPIYRALRVDKITFSALEELLGYYLDGSWVDNIKLWKLAGVKDADLYEKGRRLLREIDAGDGIILEGSRCEMGGGSLPEISIPSVALVFRNKTSAQKLAAMFRSSEPPVIGRIENNAFMLDLRTIDDSELDLLISIIKKVLNQI